MDIKKSPSHLKTISSYKTSRLGERLPVSRHNYVQDWLTNSVTIYQESRDDEHTDGPRTTIRRPSMNMDLEEGEILDEEVNVNSDKEVPDLRIPNTLQETTKYPANPGKKPRRQTTYQPKPKRNSPYNNTETNTAYRKNKNRRGRKRRHNNGNDDWNRPNYLTYEDQGDWKSKSQRHESNKNEFNVVGRNMYPKSGREFNNVQTSSGRRNNPSTANELDEAHMSSQSHIHNNDRRKKPRKSNIKEHIAVKPVGIGMPVESNNHIQENESDKLDEALVNISDSDSIVSLPIFRKSPEVIILDESGEDDDNELQLRIFALKGMVQKMDVEEPTEKTSCYPLKIKDSAHLSSFQSAPEIANYINQFQIPNQEVDSTLQDEDLRIPPFAAAVRRDGSAVLGLDPLPYILQSINDSDSRIPLGNNSMNVWQDHSIQTLLSQQRQEPEPTSICHDVDERIHLHDSLIKSFSGPNQTLSNSNYGLPSQHNRVEDVQGIPVTVSTTITYIDPRHTVHPVFSEGLRPPSQPYNGIPLPWSKEIRSDRTTPFSKEIWSVPPMTSPSPTNERWNNPLHHSTPLWSKQSPNLNGSWGNEQFNDQGQVYSNPTNVLPLTSGFPESHQQHEWVNQTINPVGPWLNGPINNNYVNWGSIPTPGAVFNPSFQNFVNLPQAEFPNCDKFQYNSLSPIPVPNPLWKNSFVPAPMTVNSSLMSNIHPNPNSLCHNASLSIMETSSQPPIPSQLHDPISTLGQPMDICPQPLHLQTEISSPGETSYTRRVQSTRKGGLAVTTTTVDADLFYSKPSMMKSWNSEICTSTNSLSVPQSSFRHVRNSTQDLEEEELRAQLLVDVRSKRASRKPRSRSSRNSRTYNPALISDMKKESVALSSSNSTSSPNNTSPLSNVRSPIITYGGNAFFSIPVTASFSNTSIMSTNSSPLDIDGLSPRSVKCKTADRLSEAGNLEITIPNRRIQPFIIDVQNDSSSSEEERQKNNRTTTISRTTISKTKETLKNCAVAAGAETINHLPPNFEASLDRLLKQSRDNAIRQAQLDRNTGRKSNLESLKQRKDNETARNGGSINSLSSKSKANDLIPSIVKHLPKGKQEEYARLKAKLMAYERVKDQASKRSRPGTGNTSSSPGNSNGVLSTTSTTKFGTRLSDSISQPINTDAQVTRLQYIKSSPASNCVSSTTSTTEIDKQFRNSQPSNSNNQVTPPQELQRRIEDISEQYTPENCGAEKIKSTSQEMSPLNSELEEINAIKDSIISVPSIIENTSSETDTKIPSPDNVRMDLQCVNINPVVNSPIHICSQDESPELSPTVNEGEARVIEVTNIDTVGTTVLTNSSSSFIFNKVVDERQELYLRQKLLKATLLRKVKTSNTQLKLAKFENLLLCTRASTIQGVNALMNKAVQISDRKVSYRNMIAHIAQLRDHLLKADQELGLSKLTIQGMVKELVEASGELQRSLQVCEKLAEECRVYGNKLSGKSYKIPERGGAEMVLKLKEIQVQAETLTKDSANKDMTVSYFRGSRPGHSGSYQYSPSRGRGYGGRITRIGGPNISSRGKPRRPVSAPTPPRETSVVHQEMEQGLTKHYFRSGSPHTDEIFLTPNRRYGDFIDKAEITNENKPLFMEFFLKYSPIIIKPSHIEEFGDTRVDPNITLCAFELRGMCHSNQCPFQHLNLSPSN